jgi:hypothetical protein
MIGKTNKNLREWANKVGEWETKYGKPRVHSFNLASILVIKRCAKCGSARAKMSRHHKGHEFLFACLMEGSYASRYIEFHPDDVNWLCNRCHVRAHIIYQPILKKLWQYVGEREYLEKPLEYDILETYRLALIRQYNHWIKYKKRKKKKYVKNRRK